MKQVGFVLSEGSLSGLVCMHKYRFLTIAQFSRMSGFSLYHAGDLLRRLEQRGAVGFFGFVPVPGHGKTPKVYFLKKRGFELLQSECHHEELGHFITAHQEASWSPQMYHRLAIVDVFLALELQLKKRPQLSLVTIKLEFRRLPGSHLRETTDYVSSDELVENRIVPDGVFVLENLQTGRQALFFLEMDMGTERITPVWSKDKRATIRGKFVQYDRYLRSGRFARTYAAFGQFRSFTLLLVTFGQERIQRIREAAADLDPQLHGYYRLATFEDATTDFLGRVWKSRFHNDDERHMLAREP